MIEAIIGIAGVILGFALSEIATFVRVRITDKKQAADTREMLRIETQVNLNLLETMWHRITDGDDRPGVIEVIRCNRLVQLPFPSFSAEGFRSHTPLLTAALSQDEISALFEFHAALARLRDLRTLATDLSRQEDENLRIASKGTNVVHLDDAKGWDLPSAPYSHRAPHTWSEMQSIVVPILKRGNPIQNAQQSG